MTTPKNGLTYADAGVDIDAGNALVDRIKPAAKATSRIDSTKAMGSYASLFGEARWRKVQRFFAEAVRWTDGRKHVLVHGEARPFAVALVSVVNGCDDVGIDRGISVANDRLPDYARVRRWARASA